MATVYPRINGEKIERLMARQRDVQLALDEHVLKGLAKAEQKLQSHRRTGNSSVTVEEGHIDRYLVLEDPPTWEVDEFGNQWFSAGSAWDIEFGHEIGGWYRGRKKAKGLRVLRDAFGPKGRL